jgi:hypothetical protein
LGSALLCTRQRWNPPRQDGSGICPDKTGVESALDKKEVGLAPEGKESRSALLGKMKKLAVAVSSFINSGVKV